MDDIISQILNAFSKSQPPTFSGADLVAFFQSEIYKDKPILPPDYQYTFYCGLDFTVPATDDNSIFRVAAQPQSGAITANITSCGALLPGTVPSAIYGTLPASLLDNLPALEKEFTIHYVDFKLYPPTNDLEGTGITVDISSVGNWTIQGLTLQFQYLSLFLDFPRDQNKSLDVALTGKIILADAADGAFLFKIDPTRGSLNLSYQKPTTAVSLSTLLKAFDIDTDLFNQLELDDFQFDLSLADNSFYLGTNLIAFDSPARLGDDDTFTLDSISLEAEYSPQGTDIQFACTLNFNPTDAQTAMQFGAQVSYSSTQAAGREPRDASVTWQVGAGWHGDMNLSDLLSFVGVSIPDLASDVDVALEAVYLSATIPDKGPKTYTLAATIDVNWQMGGDAFGDDETQFNLSYDGSAWSGTIQSALTMYGFKVTATYSFAPGKNSELKISGTFGELEISGDLTISGGKITGSELTVSFQPNPSISLGRILGDFYGLITGNPNVQLTDPWDFLNEIEFEGETQIVFQFPDSQKQIQGKTISINLGLEPISLLGVAKITAIDVVYDSTKAAGQRFAVSLEGSGFDKLGFGKPPALNPSLPSSDTGLPAKSPPLLKLHMVAAGQNVSLKESPSDIASGLQAVSALLQPAGSATELPDFGTGGWILGVELVVKGQAWLQLLFDDPDLYGARIDVRAPQPGVSGSNWLQKLVGLSAEIDYHRIGNNVGVYHGALTLPNSIAEIDLDLCTIHLPSIAADIYTDGGFDFDVGYPANGDFSNSVLVEFTEYVGSGGIFFAHLTPADAPDLPGGVVHANGQFGPMTAFGVGFKFGYGLERSLGPASAQLALTAQIVFDGVFAEFTEYANGAVTEYYNIHAIAGVSGTLNGSVDLWVITLSLHVDIEISVSVSAEALSDLTVAASASVDITISGSVGSGWFSISFSFDFHGAVDCSFKLYHGGGNAPWSQGSIAAAPVPALPGYTPATLEPFLEKFALASPVPLTVYPLPILTTNEVGAFCYAVTFNLDTSSDDFQNLCTVALAWLVYAYHSMAGLPNPPDPTQLKTDSTELANLADLLAQVESGQAGAEAFMTSADVNKFLTNFVVTYALKEKPQNQNTPLATVIFPKPTDVKVSLTSGGGEPAPNADEVLRDYFFLLARSLVRVASQTATTSEVPVSVLVQTMVSDHHHPLATVGGMLTRYFLHGNRVGSPAMPLFEATGQQLLYNDNTNSITVQSARGTLAPIDPDTGLIFSSDRIAGFKSTPTIANPSFQVFGATVLKPRLFSFKSMTSLTGDGQAAGSLWKAPRDLLRALASKNAADLTDVQVARTSPKVNLSLDWLSNNPVANYDWAVNVSFQIKPVRSSDPAGTVYSIVSIAPESRPRLQALAIELAENRGPGVKAYELVYSLAPGNSTAGKNAQATVLTVGDYAAGNFIYQNNFSTLEDPGFIRKAGASAGDFVADDRKFVYRLLAAALTNRGGFFLALAAPLPAAVFDAKNTARVELLVRLNAATGPLPQYVSALVLPAGADVPGIVAYSTACQHPARSLRTGQIKFSYAYDNPAADADDSDYQRSINNLFHLLALGPKVTDRFGKVRFDFSANPMITAPDPGSTESARTYSRILDLTDAGETGMLAAIVRDGLPTPESFSQASADPYALVGATIAMPTLDFVDIFGNTRAFEKNALPAALTVPWTDQILSLSNWPGITVAYDFNRTGLETFLELHFHWANNIRHFSRDKLASYLQIYRRIYFQLQYVDASLETSILETSLTENIPGQSLARALQNLVLEIIAHLNHPALTPIPLTAVRLPFHVDACNKSNLFALTTDLKLSLKGEYPIAAGADRGDFEVSTPLLPEGWDRNELNASRTPLFRGRNFASGLELVFGNYDYKLLSGRTGQMAAPGLWIIRYGKSGLTFSVSALPGANREKAGSDYAGCAPRPLGQALMSRTGISPNLPAVQTPADAQDIAVSNFDMDGNMRRFLIALENVLAPDFAAAVAVAVDDPESLTAIEKAKYDLAGVLSDYVLDLSTGSQASSLVRQTYQEAMLKTITQFYGIDAAVQYRLTVEAASGTVPTFEVFGGIQPDADTGLSISAVRAGLDSSGPAHDQANADFAVGVTSRDRGSVESASIGGQLVIKAFRVNLTNVAIDPLDFAEADYPGYSAGDWMQFVLPPGKNAWPVIPDQAVGLPLRSVPALPQVQSQDFAPSQPANGQMNLATARCYDLCGTVRKSFPAQDRLIVEAVPNPTAAGGLGDDPDLLDALARFASYYPGIEKALSGEDPDNLAAGVKTFAAICRDVSGLASVLPPPPPAPVVDESTYRYFVQQQAGGPSSADWIIGVTPDSASLATSGEELLVEIPGYETIKRTGTGNSTTVQYEFYQNGKPLDAATGRRLSSYRMTVRNVLDVTGSPSAQLFYQVDRNHDFAPPFRYQTSTVAFKNAVRPHLTINTPFALSTATADFHDQIISLLGALCASNLKAAQRSLWIQMSMDLGFSESNALTVPVCQPVVFNLAREYAANTTNTQAMIDCANQMIPAVQTWLQNNSLVYDYRTAPWSGLAFVFRIRMFTEMPGNETVPALSLGAALLPCGQITSIPDNS